MNDGASGGLSRSSRARLSSWAADTGGIAAHLQHVGRLYPAERHGRVVLVIDNAPWPRGKPVAEVSAENPLWNRIDSPATARS